MRSPKDLYNNGGQVTAVYSDRIFRLHFDNRREITIPNGMINNTDFSNIIYDSKPVADLSTVKYLRDMNKITLRSSYDKRLTSLSTGNKYKDYSDLAIRNFIKGALNGFSMIA